ncbi:SRPBCC domain-containing protein [Psychromicrobium xiongbiense]|uniref:SRPBCC domain-containing protein n=1 Tax=Psychromicrobium xiongbiense TaxID=3051184 RepID=UPI002553437F|nr:SRPBCC domain-containing protein [Psychromicrobium sp. YIM S02556]
MSADYLGTMELQGDEGFTLTYRRTYPQDESVLWRALTDPEYTRKWWAESRGELQPGDAWDLRWLNTPPGEPPLDWWVGTVLEVVPGRVFEIDNSVHGVLRWELRSGEIGLAGPSGPGESSTELTLKVAHGPAGGPSESLEARLNTAAGWHIHLDHLDAVLRGGTVDWDRWYKLHYPAWQQIRAEYAAQEAVSG